jgi:hypothetical protein
MGKFDCNIHCLYYKLLLFNLPEHISGVRVALSFVFYIVFCRSLFVLLSFFCLPLYCLSFFDF